MDISGLKADFFGVKFNFISKLPSPLPPVMSPVLSPILPPILELTPGVAICNKRTIGTSTEDTEHNLSKETKKRKIDDVGIFYQWEKRVIDQPLDLCSVQLWVGWTEIDKCKVCKGGPFCKTYEVVMEWGDTKQYEYISEMCADCLHTLNVTYIRNKSAKY